MPAMHLRIQNHSSGCRSGLSLVSLARLRTSKRSRSVSESRTRVSTMSLLEKKGCYKRHVCPPLHPSIITFYNTFRSSSVRARLRPKPPVSNNSSNRRPPPRKKPSEKWKPSSPNPRPSPKNQNESISLSVIASNLCQIRGNLM